MPSLKRPDPAKPAPTLKPMEDTRLRRVIRLADAIRLLGYAESHARRLIAAGRLPRPFRLAPGSAALGYFEDELVVFQAERSKDRAQLKDQFTETKKPTGEAEKPTAKTNKAKAKKAEAEDA